MRVHVKPFSAEVEFEDGDVLTYDEELAQLAADLPKWERAIASRERHGLSPILEVEDDFDDFDASAFVTRTYQ